jgi:hypothetical protein
MTLSKFYACLKVLWFHMDLFAIYLSDNEKSSITMTIISVYVQDQENFYD